MSDINTVMEHARKRQVEQKHESSTSEHGQGMPLYPLGSPSTGTALSAAAAVLREAVPEEIFPPCAIAAAAEAARTSANPPTAFGQALARILSISGRSNIAETQLHIDVRCECPSDSEGLHYSDSRAVQSYFYSPQSLTLSSLSPQHVLEATRVSRNFTCNDCAGSGALEVTIGGTPDIVCVVMRYELMTDFGSVLSIDPSAKCPVLVHNDSAARLNDVPYKASAYIAIADDGHAVTYVARGPLLFLVSDKDVAAPVTQHPATMRQIRYVVYSRVRPVSTRGAVSKDEVTTADGLRRRDAESDEPPRARAAQAQIFGNGGMVTSAAQQHTAAGSFLRWFVHAYAEPKVDGSAPAACPQSSG